MTRIVALLFAMAFAPSAHAGLGQAPFTLIGALAGGVGGAVIGAPVYGAIDPYGSDDGAEWVIIGAPMGFGVGAAIGGTLGHTIAFGGHGGRVLLTSSVVAVVGGVLLGATPALYEHFGDDRFVLSYVSGVALSVVGTPLVAFLTSATSQRDKKIKPPPPAPAPAPAPAEPAPELYLAPMTVPGGGGVVLGGTF